MSLTKEKIFITHHTHLNTKLQSKIPQAFTFQNNHYKFHSTQPNSTHIPKSPQAHTRPNPTKEKSIGYKIPKHQTLHAIPKAHSSRGKPGTQREGRAASAFSCTDIIIRKSRFTAPELAKSTLARIPPPPPCRPCLHPLLAGAGALGGREPSSQFQLTPRV